MAGGGGGMQIPERSRRGSSKRKKKKRMNFHLDMTPLVDITFLLLTFFMFTTTMVTPQVMEMNQPPETTGVEVAASHLMTLYVRHDGKLFWNIGDDDPKEIKSPTELRKICTVENLKQQVRNKLITSLKVDPYAPYGVAVAVLDELNLAEINITDEISKDKDANGKTVTRERKFTISKMDDKDKEKIEKL
jgi:biopolymer transport protein ExbD